MYSMYFVKFTGNCDGKGGFSHGGAENTEGRDGPVKYAAHFAG